MSFSLQVKEELENVGPGARHCQLAELAALVTYGCVLKHDSSGTQIELKSENEIIGRKYFTLLRKTFNMRAEVSVRKSREIRYYSIVIRCDKDARRLL